jgi:integrase
MQATGSEHALAAVTDYIEYVYFYFPATSTPSTPEKVNPFAKKPSTLNGYRKLYSKHLKSRLGKIRLFEFQPKDGQALMTRILQEAAPSDHYAKNIKNFLKGVFKWARLNGHFSTANPMLEVKVRGLDPEEDTHAYSLDEIATMMELLPEPARTVVAVAAFTGLRKSELRGLRWADLDLEKGVLQVNRAVWNTVILDKPKTKASKDLLPNFTTFTVGFRHAIANIPTGTFPSNDDVLH